MQFDSYEKQQNFKTVVSTVAWNLISSSATFIF